MVKKLFIFLLLILILAISAITVGSWMTAKELDTHWNETLDSINKSPNVRASWIANSYLPWFRSGELHLVILTDEMQRNNAMPTYDPKDLEELTASQEELMAYDSQKPTDIYIDINHFILPFYVSGSAQLDTTKGTLKKWMAKNKSGQNLPLTFSWKYFAYNNDTELSVNLDQIKIEDGDTSLNIQPGFIRMSGIWDGSMHTEYEWKGMSEVNAKLNMKTELRPMKGEYDMEPWGKVHMIPNSKFHIDGFNINSGNTKITAEDLTIDSKTDLDSSMNPGALSSVTALKAKSLGLTQNGEGSSFLFEHIDLALKFDGLDKEGFIQLLNFAEDKQTDTTKLLASLDRVTNRTITLGLKTSGLTLNGLPMQVDLNSQSIPVSGQTFMQSLMMGNFSNLFFVKGDISADKGITTKLSPDLNTMVQQQIQKGYIKESETSYQSSLLYSSGQLTINNQLVE